MARFLAETKEEMIEAFNKMDDDGNGYLSKEEVIKVLEENGDKWGDFGDPDTLFDEVDADNDGKISKEGLQLVSF